MIKQLLRVCAALTCCLIASASVKAQDIYLVSPTGGSTATAHTTVSASDWAGASNLQAALVAANASSGNPQIWVMSGTYKPAVAARDSAFVITKDGIKLYGGFAGTETAASQRDPVGNTTTLSGDIGIQNTNADNSYHVMIILPLNNNISSGTIVDGFSIVGGSNSGAGASTAVPYLNGQYIFQGYGGGILMSINNDGTASYNPTTTYYSCSPIITRCSFSGHSSGNSGGGAVYIKGTEAVCAPTFSYCHFQADTTTGSGQGGAIYYTSGTSGSSALSLATVALTNCIFVDNRASSGGAIYFSGSSATAPTALNIKGCQFNLNIATGSSGGGALYLQGQNTICTVDSSFFVADSGRLGGAIYSNLGGSSSPLTISKSFFYSNHAALASGAIHLIGTSASTSINNSVFSLNYAVSNSSSNTGGGAITVTGSNSLTLNNCSLYNDATNATSSRAGSNEVLLVSASSALTVNNSILWNNFTGGTITKLAGTATYNNSDIKGAGLSAPNLDTDPGFVNASSVYGSDNIPGTSDDGLALGTGSSAINAGSNTYAPAGTDFASNTRIQNTTVDMGAYEYALPAGPFNGLAFDGTNDYVISANNIGTTGAQPRTIEYWAKLSDVFAHQLDWGATGNTGQTFGTYTDGNGHLQFYGGGSADFTTGFVPDGAMHHVAVSYDGAYVSVFVDGVLTSAGAVARTLNTSNGKLYLGVREDLNSATFSNTTMDEVRIWNRALCQAEIQNNKNGELPTPANQSGLVLYYKFDQGTASGTNTSITTVTDASNSANNGTLTNFKLTGSSSNFVAGAAAITGDVTQYAPPAPSSSTESGSKTINGSTTINGCGVIATVAPSGSSPVSGPVTGTVTEDASVQSYGGHAYVQRHYDITPSNNASTSTGTITLYFTQADFTAYNAANGTDPNLPTTASSSDPNVSNLRVTQYHGTGTAPGNYTGSAVLITPSSVVYNSTASRWEVTFDVNGFSGFYITGNIGTPLPVQLVAFTAAAAGNVVNIKWKVAEQKDLARYTVERSADGKSFSPLSTQNPSDNQSDYAAVDNAPYNGLSYYRLKMQSLDGVSTYSTTQRIVMGDGKSYFQLSPLPATTTVTITTNDLSLAGTTAVITNPEGRTVKAFQLAGGNQKLSLEGLQSGLYFVRLANGASYKLVKQ